MGGRNVRRSVRRLTRVVILGAIAAFAAVPILATSASAQSSEDAVCTFNVLPNPIAPPFPAAVHIEGTAPAGTEVTAFSGATALVTTTANAAGNFSSGNFGVNPGTDVSATFTVAGGSYATGCANPEGLVVVRVRAAAENVQRAQAQALAFTGSNNTTSFVLIGLTALVVGIVLTVGARRRSRISS
jgi:LPXTG-motif cell wall-anchored protein